MEVDRHKQTYTQVDRQTNRRTNMHLDKQANTMRRIDGERDTQKGRSVYRRAHGHTTRLINRQVDGRTDERND